jgi:putative nucleotidyltransferase with HDIG domain
MTSKKLLKIILNKTCNILYSEDGIIMLLTNDKKHFKVTEAKGHWKDSIGRTFSIKEKGCDIIAKIDTNYFCNKNTLSTLQLESAINIDNIMFVPLKSDRKLLGVMAIRRQQILNNRTFSNINLQFLTTIGELAGIVLHRQMLHENTQKNLKELQSLRNINEAITVSLNIHVIYNVILDEITKNINFSAAAILRLKRYSGFLKYEAWRGFNVYNPKNINFHLDEGYPGQTASTLKPLHINKLKDTENDKAYKQLIQKEGFVSYHNEPLIVKGHLQGILEIFGRRPFNNDKDSFFKTLANQTSVAIENADLFYNLEISNLELISAYDSTIEGWAYALDLKDEETEGHSRRVTEMTLRIAQKLEVDKEELAHIRRGALLHDIGKMGIPDSILLKPGKLTEKEWEIMKKHPEHAFRMLSHIAFLRPALDIPYYHHEKWDGTGYPRRLKGNHIPLAARIFSVVDVYDALTNNRPYRKAWSKDKAISHICQQAGKHFDPDVVRVFLSILEQNSNVPAT